MRRFMLILISAIVAAAPLHAEEPLTLDDVLATSATHFPEILEAVAARRAAEGDALTALGAFDTVFSADAKSYATGFYDGSVIETTVSRNVRPFGAQIYGGYKLSDGDFPIYEDINFTNTGGEAKIGAIFSLLRDRTIDDRRFSTTAAELDVDKADLDILLTRIGVQHRAQIAYWNWIAAGRQLQIYEGLLELARNRQSGLEQQVREGARARIFLTENQQNITRREYLVTQARLDFETAANELSFYYRDASGDPVIPAANRLPDAGALPATPTGADATGADIPEFLALRPEFDVLRVQAEKARAKLALGRNDLKPKLDLRYETSRDFGAVAEGGISRDSTDTVVGLRFTQPFERRGARGKVRRAEAELEQLRQRRRKMEDKIEIELRNILTNLDISGQLAVLALREVGQAETMEEAERIRFRNGASDFFLVNLREERAANARIRFLDADLRARVAKADFDAATVNLDALGIGASDTP